MEIYMGPAPPTIWDSIIFTPSEWEFGWVAAITLSVIFLFLAIWIMKDVIKSHPYECDKREYDNMQVWSYRFDEIAVECFLLNVKGYITYEEYLNILQLHAELSNDLKNGDGWKHRK